MTIKPDLDPLSKNETESPDSVSDKPAQKATIRTIIMRPVRNMQVEALLTEWNLQFELLDAVDLGSITDIAGQQSRDISRRALPDKVDRYVEHMRNGAQFPPLVLREPRSLLDGNTRRAAGSKLGMQYFPAYIVKNLVSTDMARALSAAINQLNGEPLSVEDAQSAAMEMLYGELKLSVADVARYVGRSSKQINDWKKQQDTLRHAERLGLDEQLRKISIPVRKKLSAVAHDQQFRALVELLSIVRPPSAELNVVLDDVNKATSDDDAVAIIDEAKLQWIPVGPSKDTVVRNKTAARARMVIPQLMKMQPEAVFDPTKVETDHKMWVRLRDHINVIVQALDEQTGQ